MKINIKLFAILTAILVIASCKNSNDYTPINKSSNDQKSKTHEVVVKEIENAGVYSYVKVIENEEEYWIAISKSNIEVGQTYYYTGGSKMVNFKSKELDKTFDEVYFVDALRGHEKKKPDLSSLAKIEQPGGGTSIEEILSNPESFKNKAIIVKGKVVKVNRNILDRNWVHLKDGTYIEDKSSLTFTTSTDESSINVGDIVTLKGKITLDKDFGYGYVYPVLVEEAIVVK